MAFKQKVYSTAAKFYQLRQLNYFHLTKYLKTLFMADSKYYEIWISTEELITPLSLNTSKASTFYFFMTVYPLPEISSQGKTEHRIRKIIRNIPVASANSLFLIYRMVQYSQT